MNQRIQLPIDNLETKITEALHRTPTLILQAPPGSGKTTRVPQFLLKICRKKILILEPRRLAARLSAERVAEELGQRSGEDIGFQIRYEKIMGPATRCVFMTEGLFLRTLLSDPILNDVDAVVLDEFHERHLHSDVAFALTRRLQQTKRPDLKLIVMSATLDTDKLTQFLPEASFLKADVPTFPVEVEYDASTDERALEWKVTVAVESLLQDPRCPGDILVFLSGVADIRRAAQALATSKLHSQFDTFELRAELPIAEQRKIFLPHSRKKVILATNVAETSLTIPGVTGVVDSGLAKVASYAHWNGLPTLEVKPISQASSIQRSGRAGRTSAGIARRLYTRAEFLGRVAHEKPEILRVDLAQTLLEVTIAEQAIFSQHASAFMQLPWIDKPSPESVAAAENLLKELGAFDKNGAVTAIGRSIVNWPLSPRLGRILVEAKKLGTLPEACLLVSLLNEGLLTKHSQFESDVHTDCDLTFQASLFDRLRHHPQTITRQEREFVDTAQFKRIEKSFDSLHRLAHTPKRELTLPRSISEDSSPFTRELLSGFPDRIVALKKGKSSQKSNLEAIFSRGGQGFLSKSSTVQDSAFALALQADQVRRLGSTHFTTEITCASGLSSQAIESCLPDRIRSELRLLWDEQSERVKAVQRIYFEELVLEEKQSQVNAVDGETILHQQLKSQWPKPFPSEEPLEYFSQRLTLLRQKFPDLDACDLMGDDFELFLVHVCEGKKSFAEILAHHLQYYIDSFISWDLKRLLDRELPSHLTLGSGRQVQIHYVSGQAPWISSRMQDFFGTLSTPRLLNDTLPVIVHLLAPNGQAVQVTTDLASFWRNVYPEVKKELCRRYPRHYWPEDPKNAEPISRRSKPSGTQAGTLRPK